MKALLKSRVLQLAMVVALAGAVGVLLGGCSGDDEAAVDPHAGHDHAAGEHEHAEVGDIVNAAVAVAEGVEQTMCPVMGKAIDKSVFVEHEGQKVYFCCPPCKEKFTAAPADYLAKLPQFAK